MYKNINNKNLITRIFTGIIYIISVILSIQNGDKIFRIVMMSISSICFIEFLIMFKIKIELIKITFLFFFSIIFFDFLSKIGFTLYLVFFVSYFITFSIIQLFLYYTKNDKILKISILSFGLIYIVIPFLLTCYIYMLYGKKIILGIFILVWINDSLSYIIGNKWGKNKIFISISPKKSVEGYFGGLFFCILTGYLFCMIYKNNYWLFFSFIISVFSSIGDLIESIIKRHCNVKNSSIIFPGHGGFLDRLDSFIFVIPIIYTILMIIRYIL
ncbi:phosphatidate cytidylyltransferase [Blattabacterium cuenoti]|uniref:phosphatidate cytidylyltransferase n=1 Tax=Blattabacterium cuenoti TaxID=1653831 RepID=UPI00163BF2B7|nr:phosphatidate cytidylyltransferase [Blattabacterium cuenoti]